MINSYHEIRGLRLEMKVTQKQMARKIGISTSHLYKLENCLSDLSDVLNDKIKYYYSEWKKTDKEEVYKKYNRNKNQFPSLSEKQKKEINKLFFSEIDNRCSVIAKKVKAS